MSLSLSFTLPDRMFPLYGNDLISARPRVLLPEPDSPTIPTEMPSKTSKEMFSTAVKLPDLVA